MRILYINAAVRAQSRTDMLARYVLEKLGGEVTEVRPNDLGLPATDENFLKMRDKASAEHSFDYRVFDAAKQFAQADAVVIAAPFWDLSFPAALKLYFEHINVLGLTFEYSESGMPVSLCKAKKLFYVTTAGGTIFNEQFGFGYIDSLAELFYGIEERKLFKAEGLDIYGADVQAILDGAKAEIDRYFK